MRFNRDYELAIGIGSQAVFVKPPIRVVFGVMKSSDSKLNKMTVKIYNLKPSNRVALMKDEDDKKYIPLSIKVGYEGKMELIFKGSVQVGESLREGAEAVSYLECLDGGNDFLYSFTSATVRSKAEAINTVLGNMPNTARGSITNQTQLIRPKVLVGNSMRIVQDMLEPDENFFIDDEQLFILRDNEVRSGFVPLVSAKSGLMDTPSSSKGDTQFHTMMNPSLRVGGLCLLESVSAPDLNGVYKITSIAYAGDTHGNEWQQVVTGKLSPDYKVVK